MKPHNAGRGRRVPQPGESGVSVLYLLNDTAGQGLVIAQATSKAEADAFGRNYLPEFCGESIEVDAETPAEAEKVWGVRTVQLEELAIETSVGHNKGKRHSKQMAQPILFVWGPELPEDVESDNLLTAEDRRDLTLDHIARTSDFVVHLEIRKRS